MAILDVSLPLYPGCPAWPGDTPFAYSPTVSTVDGDRFTVGASGGSVHLGTHVDAPRHYVADGATIDQLDPAVFIGAATVVDIQTPGDIAAADLAAAVTDWPGRLLIRTRNSEPGGVLDRGTPATGFCGLTGDAAALVVAHNVALIGIDGYSIAAAADLAGPHRILLGAGVAVLEGLDLRAVTPGHYTLIAPPIKLAGSDGAAVRALLIADASPMGDD
jgi:arylformamidase